MINTSQARLGPRRWPRRLAIAALALIVAAVAAIAFRPEIEDRVITAFAERAMRKVRAAAILPTDRVRVILCGTSAPIPSPRRAQSCTIVAAGGRIFVFDAGTGSWRKAQASGVPAERIEGIFLTHFHSDHIGDLGEFRLGSWVAGRAAPLSVFGPQGVGAVVSGVNQSLTADTAYRRAHHGDLLSAEGGVLQARGFGLAEAETRGSHDAELVVYDRDGVRITAFQVVHEPVYPAVGYRLDWRGRSVVISGDTRPSANLIANAKGADLLIAEAQSPDLRALIGTTAARIGNARNAQIFEDIASYHMTPIEAAKAANAAGVQMLVFSHLSPPPDNWLMRRVFVRGVADFRPRKGWVLGDDQMVFDLPAGSVAVERLQPG